MYRQESKYQFSFADFYLPFGGKLSGENRWVRLAQLVPWEDFEEEYAQNFSANGMGAPAKPFRMALGSELIKRKLNITDEEVVEQLRENPYLQFFIGLECYQEEAPFDASMMTHFRERLSLDMINRINDRVIANEHKKKEQTGAGLHETEQNEYENEPDKKEDAPVSGKLLLDATCTPADIRYPTDLSLLNEAREKTERLIDRLHAYIGGKKPRTYRMKARKEYLSVAKRRKKDRKTLRRGLRKQLGYVDRNLKNIAKMIEKTGISVLSKRERRNLLVCRELFIQQKEMYKNKVNRIEARIVSITQPHVRPIKRGKAGAETEFGSKLLVSVVDGDVRIEKLSWENFNESTMFIEAVERYKNRYGRYPASVHVDKIFVTKDNRNYCKEKGIRISGPPLGRPSGDTEKNREARKQELQDAKDRIPVEGKFGNVKRKYGLDRIHAKKDNTSECEIAIGILILNLDKITRDKYRGEKLLRINIFVIFYAGLFSRKQSANSRRFVSNVQKLAA